MYRDGELAQLPALVFSTDLESECIGYTLNLNGRSYKNLPKFIAFRVTNFFLCVSYCVTARRCVIVVTTVLLEKL
jgi:hypothetical protein